MVFAISERMFFVTFGTLIINFWVNFLLLFLGLNNKQLFLAVLEKKSYLQKKCVLLNLPHDFRMTSVGFRMLLQGFRGASACFRMLSQLNFP